MSSRLKEASVAVLAVQQLTKRHRRSHSLDQREVSPEDLRGLVRACADPKFEPTKAQLSVLGTLRDELLPAWIQDRPRMRRRFEVVLKHYLAHGDATLATRLNRAGDPMPADEARERTARRQCARFLQDAAHILNEGALYRHQCRGDVRPSSDRPLSDRQQIRDSLQTYCEQTHHQAGGSGRTPDVELAQARGTNCPACQILRGLFGDSGWADAMEERERKAKRAKETGRL